MSGVYYLIIVLIVCGSSQARRKKPCKLPRSLRTNWTVVNLQSYIEWEHRECTSFQNYTVEICLQDSFGFIDCSRASSQWKGRHCSEQKTDSPAHYQCLLDLNANHDAGTGIRVCLDQPEFVSKFNGYKKCLKPQIAWCSLSRLSTFTSPNLTLASVEANSFVVNIQEPSGLFLQYFTKISYNIYYLKLEGSTRCDESLCREEKRSINSTNLSKCQSQDLLETDHGRTHWKVEGLDADSRYCVCGRYSPPPIQNRKGPSEIGFVEIRTEKAISFMIGIIIGIIVACLVIFAVIVGCGWNQKRLLKKSIEIDLPIIKLITQDLPSSSNVEHLRPIVPLESPDPWDRVEFQKKQELEKLRREKEETRKNDVISAPEPDDVTPNEDAGSNSAMTSSANSTPSSSMTDYIQKVGFGCVASTTSETCRSEAESSCNMTDCSSTIGNNSSSRNDVTSDIHEVIASNNEDIITSNRNDFGNGCKILICDVNMNFYDVDNREKQKLLHSDDVSGGFTVNIETGHYQKAGEFEI